MNLSLKTAVASMLDKSGVISAVRNYRSSRSGIVLTLHRVLPAAEAKESFEPAITITDTIFEQLLILLQREFRVVDLNQLLDQPEDIEGRQRVAITFDDGWSDTYAFAYPLLLRYELPATIFLCPGLMAHGQVLPEERFARIWRWCAEHQQTNFLVRDLRKWGLHGGESADRYIWSRLLKRLALNAKLLMLKYLETTYAVPPCEERRFLAWDEVKIMRRSNLTFGSHTLLHSTLTAEQHPALDEQLRRSRETLEFRLQEDIRLLAYPNGAYDLRVMEAARQAGYSHCFTTARGALTRGGNCFAIPRIHIDNASLVNQVYSMNPSRARFHLQHFARQPSGR